MRLVALAAVLTMTVASAALAAAGTAGPRPSVAAQRLDTRIHQALLSLYALDSQLHASRARVASVTASVAALRQQRAVLRQESAAAGASLRVAQHGLAVHLRALYEQGNVDPVAVVLGSSSIRTALQRLDDLSQVADEDRQVVAATITARSRFARLRLRQAGEARRLARSLAAAQRAERQLVAEAAARLNYLASLRAREHLHATQVQHIVTRARAVQQRAQHLQPNPAPPARGARKLVVSATCYDLPGRTATGMPVGWGVVAVDPSVIPLGTRMHIPGYGNGVAADVGGGIRGNIIDLWMTRARCMAWGRRTVTITIY